VKVGTPIKRLKKEKNDERVVIFEPATIMVVDDVHSNVETVENLLDTFGLQTITADNGEIALEIIKHTSPSLILMDLRMPGMNGFEVSRKIKEMPGKENIPIIAFTASVFSANKITESPYFDDLLLKPVRRQELINGLSKFIKHKTISKSPKSEQRITKTEAEEIPDSVKQNLSEIIEILNNTFRLKWENIKDTLVLFNIENFAKELKNQGFNVNSRFDEFQPLFVPLSGLEIKFDNNFEYGLKVGLTKEIKGFVAPNFINRRNGERFYDFNSTGPDFSIKKSPRRSIILQTIDEGLSRVYLQSNSRLDSSVNVFSRINDCARMGLIEKNLRIEDFDPKKFYFE
ncbi:MAG: response regulator, partial [Nanoarchaeota archaeon]